MGLEFRVGAHLGGASRNFSRKSSTALPLPAAGKPAPLIGAGSLISLIGNCASSDLKILKVKFPSVPTRGLKWLGLAAAPFG